MMVWALTAALVERKSAQGKQREAQVDGGGIHGIQRLLESQSGVLALVQVDGGGDQTPTERLEHLPVAPLVGLGQSRPGDFAANGKVIEFAAMRIQACDEVAQPFSPSELRIRDAQEMIPRREVPDAVIRFEPIDQVLEMIEGNEVQQLRKNRPAAIHGIASIATKSDKDTRQNPIAMTNRRNQESRQSPSQY